MTKKRHKKRPYDQRLVIGEGSEREGRGKRGEGREGKRVRGGGEGRGFILPMPSLISTNNPLTSSADVREGLR